MAPKDGQEHSQEGGVKTKELKQLPVVNAQHNTFLKKLADLSST
jgi:hypothetical protein